MSLDTFKFHGVTFNGESGNQHFANCPFCMKPNKLYVNPDNGGWDCKSCQKKGYPPQFLGYLGEKYAKNLNGDPLARLVENRGIPAEVLIEWGVGWDGARYTILCKDPSGKAVDLRVWKPGGPLMSTKGASTGLFGIENIPKGKGTVYLCEGEWDTMALSALAKKLKKDVCTVGVPGAGTFKKEWIAALHNKNVIVLYDNDEAGENGERVVLNRLKGVASSLQFIQWPGDVPDGFDVRDWVGYGLRLGKAEDSWTCLHKLLISNPRKATPEEKSVARAVENRNAQGPANADEVIATYGKWLQLDEPEVLDVMFGTCFANRLQGEPVWMFLVAPPGGMKSELLMSLKEHGTIYATTSLTPHAMVSGAYSPDGKDPSLLPHLDEKMLVIKDFTTILTMHYSQRDEIFGIFRDVYDGSTGKNFGTGVRREYNVKFGILAGVTNKIEAFGAAHQSLGERFLKFRASEDKRESEEDKIRRALGNVGVEVAMRTELTQIAARCLDRTLPEVLPNLSAALTDRLIALAQLIAMLRGVVDRNVFDKTVLSRPSYEVGTRLAKQFAKLGIGIAIFRDLSEVGEREFKIIQRVALDTAPDRIETIVRRLWTAKTALKTLEISDLTRLPQATVFRVLQDLELLRIVDRSGDGQKHMWSLNSKIVSLIQRSGVYDVPLVSYVPSVKPSPLKLRTAVRS